MSTENCPARLTLVNMCGFLDHVPDGVQIYDNGMGGYLGVVHMIDTLRGFLELTGALTVPSLDEYEMLPDKVCSLQV